MQNMRELFTMLALGVGWLVNPGEWVHVLNPNLPIYNQVEFVPTGNQPNFKGDSA